MQAEAGQEMEEKVDNENGSTMHATADPIAVSNGDNVIPVDCFVAPAQSAETVIICTDVEVSVAENESSVHISVPETPPTESANSTVFSSSGSSVANPNTEDVAGSCSSTRTNEEEKIVEVKVIPLEMLYDGTMWSQIDLAKASEEEMFASVGDSIPLTVSDGVTDVARQVEVTTRSDNMCLSIRDITKRERDRQKKRVLRADPLFREKEKVKAKERMKQRRMDPMYRDQERQRDRERRQLARRRNHTMRDRERERDKEYKRTFRYGSQQTKQSETVTDSCPALDTIPCHVYLSNEPT